MNRAELERRAQLWQRHRALRAAWLAAAAGLVAACGVVRASAVGAVLTGIVVAVGAWLLLRRPAPPVTAATIAAHLNRLCPALEESAGLWLGEAGALTLVERLQLRRLDAAWEAQPDRATLGCPRARALRPAIALGAAAAVALSLVAGWPRGTAPTSIVVPSVVAVSIPAEKAAPPGLRSATLEITPPAYLGAVVRRVEGLDAEVPEGSVVTWEIAFAGAVAALSLDGANAQDPVSAEALGGGRFLARATIADTRLYQLAITRADGVRVVWPEVHALKAIRDLPPRLTWQEPAAARTVVDPAKGAPLVAVRLGAADDHGVAAVTLVMTVAKGSGESVKFREQEVTLERAPGGVDRGEIFGRVLDLAALGLEPGDELYFHALATDHRAPAPNRTRSETRFVILRGPETELGAPAVAIAGLNRVPQYFRSQRQLIIDTERLLVERPALPAEKFRERAEDIGIDQKLLRLRYGQFLGEEFEPASGGAPREAQAMAMAAAIRGQARETASRATAVERAIEAQHAHPTAPDREGRPLTLQEAMAPFVHQHDNAEAATLFDAHVKASLRGVLAAMWEAEGFLRTGRPAEALPAENRALELLKALQQADRIYVKRVGYEPTPLKIAERRLRGELEAIPRRALGAVPSAEPSADRAVLEAALAGMTEGTLAQMTVERAAIVDARLAAAAQEKPEAFLAALEIWRRRAEGLGEAERAALRRALWSLLPPAEAAPARPGRSAPGLARDYFEALTASAGGAR